MYEKPSRNEVTELPPLGRRHPPSRGISPRGIPAWDEGKRHPPKTTYRRSPMRPTVGPFCPLPEALDFGLG